MIFHLLLLILLSNLSKTCAFNQEENQNINILKGKSFSVKSSIRTYLYDRDQKFLGYQLLSKVEEFYSYEQQRAALKFHLLQRGPGQPASGWNVGRFYYDYRQEVALLLDDSSKQMTTDDVCKLSSIEELNLLIYFQTPISLNDDTFTNFLIGPAKLLYFTIMHRNKMKLVSLEATFDVRNIPCLEYVFDYDTQSVDGVIKISAFYSEKSLAIDPNSLPIYISISYGKTYLVFTYSDLEIYNHDYESLQFYRNDENSLLFNDRFIFPNQCLNALMEEEQKCKSMTKYLVEQVFDINKRKKFSFQSKIQHFSSKLILPSFEEKTFVSYDSDLQSMRIDNILLNDDDDQSHYYHRLLFNFKFNKVHHIIDKASQNDDNSTIDKILDLTKEQKNKARQCATSNFFALDKDELTISKLLLGSNELNKFIYFGKTSLRNINALVYKTKQLDLIPFWIEQPVNYIVDGENNGAKVKKPQQSFFSSSDDMSVSMTILVSESDNSLLYIELERPKVSNKNLDSYDREIITIFDFIWHNPSESYTNEEQHQIELFSLNNYCFDHYEMNTNYDIDMILNIEHFDEQENVFMDKNTRNLALLATLQNEPLKLPINYIYDFRTKLHLGNNHFKYISPLINDKNYQLIMVNFKFVNLIEANNNVELIYLGLGRQRNSWSLETIKYSRSLEECYFIAAHLKENVYFGYNQYQRVCFIDTKPIVRHDDEYKFKYMQSFSFSQNGIVEIYQTKHEKKIDSKSLDIFRDEKELIKLKNSRLISTNFNFSLRIKRFSIHNKDDYPSKILDNNQNKLPINWNKIKGYGLVINKEKVDKILFKLETSLQDKLMTYDNCHTYCISDFDCRSFSTCIQDDGEFQCIISKIDFKSQNNMKVISDYLFTGNGLVKKLNKKGSFNLTLEDSFKSNIDVQFIKHPNCNIYNKNFMDLFNEYKHKKINKEFDNRRIHLVSDKENCAQLCVEHNMNVLIDDDNHSLKASTKFLSHEKDEKLNEEDITRLIDEHKFAVSQLCQSFFYLDQQDYSDLSEELQNSVRLRIHPEMDNNSVNNSYCIYGDRPTLSEIEKLKSDDRKFSSKVISFEKYEFKLDFFYQKQYGIKLKGSMKDHETQLAYNSILNQKINESNYMLMKNFVDKGENSQLVHRDDPYWCAVKCFLQYGLIWPNCKSFDIVVSVFTDNNTNTRTDELCLLNSISLKEAEIKNRFDLIEYQSNMIDSGDDNLLTKRQHVEFWHYEPKGVTFLSQSIIKRNLELSYDESIIQTKQFNTTENYLSVGGIEIFFIIIFSSIIGLLLGCKIAIVIILDRKENYYHKGESHFIDTNNLIENEMKKNNSN